MDPVSDKSTTNNRVLNPMEKKYLPTLMLELLERETMRKVVGTCPSKSRCWYIHIYVYIIGTDPTVAASRWLKDRGGVSQPLKPSFLISPTHTLISLPTHPTSTTTTTITLPTLWTRRVLRKRNETKIQGVHEVGVGKGKKWERQPWNGRRETVCPIAETVCGPVTVTRALTSSGVLPLSRVSNPKRHVAHPKIPGHFHSLVSRFVLKLSKNFCFSFSVRCGT